MKAIAVEEARNESGASILTENIYEHFTYPSVVTPTNKTLLIKTCFPAPHNPSSSRSHRTNTTGFSLSSPNSPISQPTSQDFEQNNEQLENGGEIRVRLLQGENLGRKTPSVFTNEEIVRIEREQVSPKNKQLGKYKRVYIKAYLKGGGNKGMEIAVNCKRFQKIRRYILDHLCRLPPSIPSNPNFGYFETQDGRLKALRPEQNYHTGKGADKIGPGHYTPRPLNRIGGTPFHKSQSKREIFSIVKNTIGPGSYERKRESLGDIRANPSYNSTSGSCGFASHSQRFGGPFGYGRTQSQGEIGTTETDSENNNILLSNKSKTYLPTGTPHKYTKIKEENENKRKHWEEVIKFIHREAAKNKGERINFDTQLTPYNNYRNNNNTGSRELQSKTAQSPRQGSKTGFLSSRERFERNTNTNMIVNMNMNTNTNISKDRRALSSTSRINCRWIRLGGESMTPYKGGRNSPNHLNKCKTYNNSPNYKSTDRVTYNLHEHSKQSLNPHSTSFKVHKHTIVPFIPLHEDYKLNNLRNTQANRVLSTKKINKALGICKTFGTNTNLVKK